MSAQDMIGKKFEELKAMHAELAGLSQEIARVGNGHPSAVLPMQEGREELSQVLSDPEEVAKIRQDCAEHRLPTMGNSGILR